MNKLKVCFVGVGSIAKRHIRNLNQICKEKNIELNIDALRHKGGNIEGINNIYLNYDLLPTDYDVIFITNPTELHLETLKKIDKKGKNIFIEKTSCRYKSDK